MSDAAVSGQPVSMMKYAGWFAVAYFGGLVLLTAIGMIFDIDIGRIGSMAVLFSSAIFAGSKFGKEQGRLFDGGERWTLSLLCLLASVLVSAGSIAIVTLFMPAEDASALFAMLGDISAAVWAVVALILAVIEYFVIFFFLGSGAKGGVKQAAAKAETVFD
ncbi:MAG: hypothetical protein EP335_14865 [Alphaproteobacteria bacterium]|nr:MAG: hypothetical protein EP335_14865 [Alphaproteobacteria bacterium]